MVSVRSKGVLSSLFCVDLRSTYATRLSAGGVAERMGDADAAPERRASHEEVFPDEAEDEARSAGETQPPSQRNETE